MRKLFLIAAVLSSLVLVGCTENRFSDTVRNDPPNPVQTARVTVNPQSHDFGDIVQSQGPVSTTFTVKNTGSEPLIINRLFTSCGCTAAEMETSPLPPDQSRTMTVTFDPMVHPDQFGVIERVVYLQTSDPEKPEVEIDIRGNVTQ